MALGIMFLDVFELRRLAKRRYIPIQLSHPTMQRRIPGAYVADVAFEMLDVDGVEADDGCVEADVGFGDVTAEVVGAGGGLGGEVGFGAREGGEEGLDGGFVGGLCSGVWRMSNYWVTITLETGWDGMRKRGKGVEHTGQNRFCRRRC